LQCPVFVVSGKDHKNTREMVINTM
jgi:hypothetical protein